MRRIVPALAGLALLAAAADGRGQTPAYRVVPDPAGLTGPREAGVVPAYPPAVPAVPPPPPSGYIEGGQPYKEVVPVFKDKSHLVNQTCLSSYARPTNQPSFTAGWVGGGCLRFKHGDGPAADEGTFGWDYIGCKKPWRIFLGWCHCNGREMRGGTYATTSPIEVPDPIAAKPVRRILSPEREGGHE